MVIGSMSAESPPCGPNRRWNASPAGGLAERIAAAFICLTLLAGCASAVVGAGATVGVAALDERGVEGVARDTALATRIRAKWLNHDLIAGSRLAVVGGVKVYERRALLTGRVETEATRVAAVRLAWEVEGVDQVLNEIAVGPGDLQDTARDTWITTQLTTKLTLDQNVKAVNYGITTTDARVYLIGIAQDAAELDRVLGHARSVARVRDVINHIRVKPPAPAKPTDKAS